MDEINWDTAFTPHTLQQPTIHRPAGPTIDAEVSRVVGKPVVATDPRLLKLVVSWKRNAGTNENADTFDEFLKDPKKIAELKKVFG